jgi:hypothetical protein
LECKRNVKRQFGASNYMIRKAKKPVTANSVFIGDSDFMMLIHVKNK